MANLISQTFLFVQRFYRENSSKTSHFGRIIRARFNGVNHRLTAMSSKTKMDGAYCYLRPKTFYFYVFLRFVSSYLFFILPSLPLTVHLLPLQAFVNSYFYPFAYLHLFPPVVIYHRLPYPLTYLFLESRSCSEYCDSFCLYPPTTT